MRHWKIEGPVAQKGGGVRQETVYATLPAEVDPRLIYPDHKVTEVPRLPEQFESHDPESGKFRRNTDVASRRKKLEPLLGLSREDLLAYIQGLDERISALEKERKK